MAGAGGVYVGGGATVVMNPPPMIYVQCFHPGSGPDRHLRKKAEAVAVMARTLSPVRSGLLKSTIKASQNRNELGRFAFGFNVSAGTRYGYYVHEGTGPSPRWPSNKKVMKFPGSLGDTVYRDFVMHPGTPAQPFLRDALVAMAD
jgi:hypothetical protein